MSQQQHSIQTIAAANAANIEAIRSLTATSLNAAERLLNLNLDLARLSLRAGAPMSQQADWQQHTKQAADYFRGVYEISTEAQANASEVLSSRVEELADSVTSLLDDVARSAPPNSGKAFEAAKSAVATACSAYSRLIRNSQPASAPQSSQSRKVPAPRSKTAS